MAGELCEDQKSRNMVNSAGFCYSDNPNIQTQFTNQIHSFDSNPEIFNLSTNMEMIGFSKNHLHNQAGPSSSSKTMINGPANDFYDHQTLVSVVPDHNSAAWQENRFDLVDHHDHDDDDSSLRCVFSCAGNGRPSQGLSLSLSSTNPSTIGLQSFELTNQNPTLQPDFRFFSSSRDVGLFGKSENFQQKQIVQDGFLSFVRNSKYLGPAQEILNEFCSLGLKQSDEQKQKVNKIKQWEDGNNASSSSRSSSKPSLYSNVDFIELQKRKSKLFSMLEELERRYRHYCDQMKAVASTFEAMAGTGAARVYTSSASKAMSRHFKCLKDGIVGQIEAIKKAMGEKDPIAPGTTKGETPRLRILDQTLRQQRAFQQMSLMESHPWRPQRGLPERSVSILRAWLFEHFLHPYPSDVDKHILARQTGLSRSQVSNWFINARVRLWKPMVEEMYMEEIKEQENNNISPSNLGPTNLDPIDSRSNPNPDQTRLEDKKLTTDQLLRIDSDCLSSIIITPEHHKSDSRKDFQTHQIHQILQQHSFSRANDAFGSSSSMELDFYSGMVSYANHDQNTTHGYHDHHQNVSLTLGLQQHGDHHHHHENEINGVNLGFSNDAASQSSVLLYRTRSDENMEECDHEQVQYSLLDGDQGVQTLPYRNLMGAQLLRDLTG